MLIINIFSEAKIKKIKKMEKAILKFHNIL